MSSAIAFTRAVVRPEQGVPHGGRRLGLVGQFGVGEAQEPHRADQAEELQAAGGGGRVEVEHAADVLEAASRTDRIGQGPLVAGELGLAILDPGQAHARVTQHGQELVQFLTAL